MVHNELLNRIKPSSNANRRPEGTVAGDSRHPRETRLGIDGLPAEGGLYAALIERRLACPDPESRDFRFCRRSFERMLVIRPMGGRSRAGPRKSTSTQVSMADIFSHGGQRLSGSGTDCSLARRRIHPVAFRATVDLSRWRLSGAHDDDAGRPPSPRPGVGGCAGTICRMSSGPR